MGYNIHGGATAIRHGCYIPCIRRTISCIDDGAAYRISTAAAGGTATFVFAAMGALSPAPFLPLVATVSVADALFIASIHINEGADVLVYLHADS